MFWNEALHVVHGSLFIFIFWSFGFACFCLVSLVNSSHWLRVFLFFVFSKLFCSLGLGFPLLEVVEGFCVCNINTQNKYALRSIIAHCFGLMFFRVG